MPNSKWENKMHLLVDRWSLTTVLFFCLIKLLQGIKCIFPSKEDGWRRATRAFFRTEQAKFGFGSFSVKMPVVNDLKDELPRKLLTFLKGCRIPCISLEWGLFSVKISKKETCDLVLAEYAQDGSMTSLRPFLEKALPGNPPEIEDLLIKIIMEAFNKTKDQPDKKRPRYLKKEIDKRFRQTLANPAAGKEMKSGIKEMKPGIYEKRAYSKEMRTYINEIGAYIERVLSAVYVCLDISEKAAAADERFQDPQFIRMKHPGFGPLQFFIRTYLETNNLDIWALCSHVPVDGTPVVEMLQNLKKAWEESLPLPCPEKGWGTSLSLPYSGKALGTSLPLPYPRSGFATKPVLCSSGGLEIYQLELFLDFSSFFSERSRLMQDYEMEISVLALLAWGLSCHPVFKPIKFLFPCDLPESADRERTLGLVYMHPSKYYDSDSSENGFLKFHYDFREWLKATKSRHSASYELVESFALLPPMYYMLPLKIMPKALGNVIGTMGVSVIKDAEFAIGARSDVHTDGFIAFGNLRNPSCGQSEVGVVSIKGSNEQIKRYTEALREIFNDFKV